MRASAEARALPSQALGFLMGTGFPQCLNNGYMAQQRLSWGDRNLYKRPAVLTAPRCEASFPVNLVLTSHLPSLVVWAYGE